LTALQIGITGRCGERQTVGRGGLGRLLMWAMVQRLRGSEMFKWE